MFENFVQEKIENENAVIKNIFESLPAGGFISKGNIINSGLSDFSKNYLLFDFNEKNNLEELTSKISRSNKLLFNYTTRPKWTLQAFLFNNFESRPPNEILNKLNLFTHYNYYSDAIKDFIKENAQIFITKHEISSIIEQANNAIYEKLTNEINSTKIKNLFLQVFLLKYETESDYNLESTIPFSFIQIFLEDKSFTELEKKFKAVKGLKNETELSLKDIIKVLSDKYNLSEAIESKDRSGDSSEIVLKIPVSKEEIVIVKEEAEAEDISIDDKKISIELSEDKKAEINIPEARKEDIIEKDSAKESEMEKLYSQELENADLNEKEEKINDTEITLSSDNELKNLFSKKLFTKILVKVYKSDPEARDNSFNTMINFKSWSEASLHLKNIFQLNDVDLFNKAVVSFVNILNDHYKNKE